MRLGLSLWPDRDPRLLADLAAAAEEAGFDDVWFPDHYNIRDSCVVMALAAMRTSRVRLGSAVTTVLLRHPAILASFYATLSEISNGRAIAGLGPGGFEVKTELKVTTPSPLAATRESVEIMRGLLAGERVSSVGRAFQVDNARLGFKPPSPVPIWLAGRGLRMLELAGEVADGVITHGLARSYLDLAIERVRAGEARAGRASGTCAVALMLEVRIDDDFNRARDSLRPGCLFMAGGEYAEDLIPRYGLDPDAVKRLRAAVRAADPKAVSLIDDSMVDAFTLGGPAGYVVDRLRMLAAGGVDTFILGPGKRTDAETILKLGRAVREVLR